MQRVFLRLLTAGAVFAAGLQVTQADQSGPTLSRVRETGALVIGYREGTAPLSYTGPDAQPIGLALDLCAMAAGKIKDRLGLPDLKVTYQAATAADAAALLEKGAIAIDCGATPVTPDLEKQVAFSGPIFISELTWLVPRRLRVEREGRRRRRIETIEPLSPGDLKDKTVALSQGSPAIPIVLSLSNDQTLGLSLVEGKDNAEAFKFLESGKASALIADDAQLAALKASARNPDSYSFLSGGNPGAAYALMVRKDDTDMKALVDGVISEAAASGAYAKLYAKWFDGPIPPKNVTLAYPMRAKLKEALKVRDENPSQ
jgi:glutamate/aspartate transport system substrate-binding protein